MKVVFDNNISYRIVKKLSEQFPNAQHVSRIGIVPPVPDLKIWQYAIKEERVIITFDEDFETLSNLYGFPPKVILLRFGNSSTNYVVNILKERLEEIENFYHSPYYGLLEIY